MWTSMWYTSVLSILVADIRTGALQNKEIEPQQCYHCLNVNSTACTLQKVSVLCPVQQPYCGTVAEGPSFISLLTCLPDMDTPCSIKPSNWTYKMSCLCTGHLCNAPFSKRIQNQLLQFAKTNIEDNSSDVTNYLKFLKIDNATDIYKTMTKETEEENIGPTHSDATLSTIKVTEVPQATLNRSKIIDAPHAEPLKHEATVPPDDDEDESEGSGSYDESRSQKHPASAPAAPSSFLPAEENKASSLFKNILASIPIIICIIM